SVCSRPCASRRMRRLSPRGFPAVCRSHMPPGARRCTLQRCFFTCSPLPGNNLAGDGSRLIGCGAGWKREGNDMPRFLRALVAGIGMALVVGGVCGLMAGLATHNDVTAAGLGPLNGIWSPHDLRFVATMAAGVGAGLFTFALFS